MRICFIIRVCINCSIPAQIPCLEKKCGSWDMDQNAVSQSDCRIFKSSISSEQIDEMTRLFVTYLLLDQFIQIHKN